MRRLIKSAAFLILICLLASLRAFAAAALPRVGLVPLDNRPVCFSHVKKIGRLAGLDMAAPPYSAIGAFRFDGNPDAVLDWVESNAPRLDVLILSVEMATTGGLVASRTPAAAEQDVLARLRRIEDIAKNNPNMKIWAFGILQRIARTGTDNPKIDEITADMAQYLKLLDEADVKADKDILARAKQLEKQIPESDLKDYLAARKRNHASNMKIIDMAARGVFDLLVIGMDDNAVYGPHRAERDELNAEISRRGAGGRVTVKPGADELAQLLTARAALWGRGESPAVYVAVSDAASLKKIPSYEDRPLDASITLALELAGARRAPRLEGSWGALLLHSDENDNAADAALGAKLLNQGHRLSVADVSTLNHGSLAFVTALGEKAGGLGKLAGYGGWNTASNALGTAVAMLLIETPRDAVALGNFRREFTFERFADDALFMDEVRPRIQKETFPGATGGEKYVNMRGELVDSLRSSAAGFYAKYFDAAGKTTVRVDLLVPWFRLFEIDVQARILPAGE